MKFITSIFFILLSVKPVSAQVWNDSNKANTLSNISVGASISLDLINDFRSNNKKHAFLISAERLGLKILIAEVTKRLIHEDRPDHSDNKSCYRPTSAKCNSYWISESLARWNL